jgi:hypothetical protein
MIMTLEIKKPSAKDLFIYFFILIVSVSFNFANIHPQKVICIQQTADGQSILTFNIWGYHNVTIVDSNINEEYTILAFNQYYIEHPICGFSDNGETPIYIGSKTIFYIGSQNNLLFIRVMLVIVYILLFLILLSLFTNLYTPNLLLLVILLLLMISIGLIVNNILNSVFLICNTVLFVYLLFSIEKLTGEEIKVHSQSTNNVELVT